MHRFSVLLLAAVQFVSGSSPTVSQPKVIQTYSIVGDLGLGPLPAGYVRTLSLSFSPDERWIAVLAGARADHPRNVGPAVGSTLLLVPFLALANQPVRIDPGMPIRSEPFWSPDSRALAMQGTPRTEAGALREAGIPKVYDLHGQQLWSRPEAGAVIGFLTPNRLLAYHLGKKDKLAGFDTVDIRTGAVTPWISEPHGRLAALDPASDRVALFSDADSKTLILDYPSGRILQSLRNQTRVTGSYPGRFPFQYFAENGTTLCSVETVDKFETHPTCIDVDTGKPVGDFSRFQGGAPAVASSRGSRMVLSDLTYLPDHPGAYTFGGRVVWDFRTDSEVAAWGPSTPQITWLATQSSGIHITPVAISATGRYLAESFGSEIRIYQIP